MIYHDKKVNPRFPQLLLKSYLSFVYKPWIEALLYASWAVLGEGCSSACGREAPGALVLGEHASFGSVLHPFMRLQRGQDAMLSLRN
jgi:hypothetical protein